MAALGQMTPMDGQKELAPLYVLLHAGLWQNFFHAIDFVIKYPTCMVHIFVLSAVRLATSSLLVCLVLHPGFFSP